MKGGKVVRAIRERVFEESEFRRLLGIPETERIFTVTKQHVEEQVPKGKIDRLIVIVNTEAVDARA